MIGLGKRLLYILLAFTSTLVAGALGYRFIEGWTFFEGLYMSVISITTVGFTEVRPLSPEGRIFTSILIMVGVAVITFSFGAITRYFVAGEIRGLLGERKMRRIIQSMHDHILVCGFGRMGYELCRSLQKEGKAFIVVDPNENSIRHAQDEGYIAYCGDPGKDETLRECRIDRAAGLAAVSDDDGQNLMVVLSARTLKPDLTIVARVSADDGPGKFLRAGANNVFLPYQTGGQRLAQLLVRPKVIGFLEQILFADSPLKIQMDNFRVGEGCEIEGSNLREARIRERTGVYIVGLVPAGTGAPTDLEPSTVLNAGDTVIALGKREQLDCLARMLKSPE